MVAVNRKKREKVTLIPHHPSVAITRAIIVCHVFGAELEDLGRVVQWAD
jgi:hypothetical protein